MERQPLVITAGILNICFAAWRLVRTGLESALQSRSATAKAVILGRIHAHPEYALWIKWGTPVNLLSCFILIVSGIGLLRMKGWARKVAIGYGIYAIILGILGGAMDFDFIVRPALQEIQLHPRTMYFGLIEGVVAVCIMRISILIYPILLLVFMTRPAVAASLRRSSEPPNLPC